MPLSAMIATAPVWILYWIFPFCVGACVGSFLNVVVYRVPLGRSIVHPGSHCAACGKPLKWFHNIPMFSWLALRGRAACCGTPIDGRYPVVELLTAVMTVVFWNSFTPAVALVLLIWVYALIVATFIDLDHFIIPDTISMGGWAYGLAASLLVPALHQTEGRGEALVAALIGFAVGGGGLWAVAVLGRWILKKDAMGLGDVKLLGAMGALAGWQSVLFTLAAASVMGSLVGVVVILRRRKKSGVPIPFGPFLAAGFILFLLGGREWFAAYLAAVGFGD